MARKNATGLGGPETSVGSDERLVAIYKREIANIDALLRAVADGTYTLPTDEYGRPVLLLPGQRTIIAARIESLEATITAKRGKRK